MIFDSIVISIISLIFVIFAIKERGSLFSYSFLFGITLMAALFFTVIVKGMCVFALGLEILMIDGSWTCLIPQLTHYNFTISAITACVVSGIFSCIGWSWSSLAPESRLLREVQEEAIKSRVHNAANCLIDVLE